MFVASVNPYVVGLITCIATMSLSLKLQEQTLMEHKLRHKIDPELRAIMIIACRLANRLQIEQNCLLL